jgi:NAD(P)-dependent dehydrogenase (short-subunit alcohol dehydrogenase family)
MPDLLDHRTVLVTGIGQAVALGCAARGANAVAADMNPADDTVAATWCWQ